MKSFWDFASELISLATCSTNIWLLGQLKGTHNFKKDVKYAPTENELPIRIYMQKGCSGSSIYDQGSIV